MQMEHGLFGGEALPDGYMSEVFEARVLIPEAEFARLGLGDHERPASLPACFRWCYDNLGQGGRRWSVMLRDRSTAAVYFARAQEALAFLARWSADAAAPAGRLALAS
jgi:hypothetical protein